MENRLNVPFNCLRYHTIRILQSIISSGTYTIREIREFFKPRDISDEELRELESVETVDELWEYLINREIITMDNVRALRTVAKNGVHSEELTREVEQYERNVGGMAHRARLVIKIGISLAIELAVVSFLGEEEKRIAFERLVFPQLLRLVEVYKNSVCFMVETTSLPSLKQLWMSYKDGLLKEKLKKAINEINEVRKLTNGTEIDLKVKIDEDEYHEACWMLAQINQGADQKKKIHDDLPSAGPSVEEIAVESTVKREDAASNQTDDSKACSSTREEVKKSWVARVKEYFKQKLGLNSGETGASTQDGKNIDGYFEKYENFAINYNLYVLVLDLENMITLRKYSVGAIIAVNVSNVETCAGTCFRIGTRYVITNKHVIDDIEKHGILLQKCYVDFNYQEQGPADLRFAFAPSPVLVTSEELDYAILELHPDDKREFPPSVIGSGYNIAPAGRKLQSEDCLTLVGHPNGAKKQIDVSCPIKDQDDIQQHLGQVQSKLNETDFASLLFYIQNTCSNPHVATYDVGTFFHGSGSPGFLLEEKLLVVLHAGGILFEGTAKKNHVLEYGILMSSVVEDVKRKINVGEIQDVPLSDIFNDSNAFTSSPEPMDIDQVPGL